MRVSVRRCFQHSGNTAVGAWKKRWRLWGCPGALVCRSILSGVDTSFERCFKELDYEKALRARFVSRRELAMSVILPEFTLVPFRRLLKSLHLLSNWTKWGHDCNFEY